MDCNEVCDCYGAVCMDNYRMVEDYIHIREGQNLVESALGTYECWNQRAEDSSGPYWVYDYPEGEV